MNPDVKASGGESSVINSIFSLTEPEVDGGVLDIHEGQHLEVVARGNSCTRDTDLVEPAGEEPGRMEQGRLAPAVETARVEADGSLVQDERPGESLAAESIEQAGQDRIDKELIDRDRVMAETAEVQLGKSGDPLWPGWTSEILSEGGRQNRLYWVPPSREIAFREWQQASDFEHLRVECDNDEDKALAKLKKTTTKKIRYKRLSKPRQKTTRVTAEYREMKRGLPNRVVSPEQYDVEAHLNRATKEIALSERGKQQNRTPLPRSGQMTGRFRKPMAVDQKWASSLVGLRLKVPAHWWNNWSGNTLYAGQIADINFSDDAKRYFMLKLDSEENRNLYPLRYDAVLCYADKEHPTHSRFDLPEKPPAPADPNVTESGNRKCREELVQAVPKAKKLQKTSHKAAKKLSIGCIKSKGKNTPVIKSTKNHCDSPARKLYHKDSTPSYLWVSPFKSSARPTLNDGLNCSNIKITRLKETKKTSFFEDKFKGRILLVESSLNQGTVPEKTVTYVSEHG
jgi:hypothetical protein